MFSVAVALASNGAAQSNSSSVSMTTLRVGRVSVGKKIASQRGSADLPALSRIESDPDIVGEVLHSLADLGIGVLEGCQIAAVGIGDHPGKSTFLEEASQHQDGRRDE